jgi:hypothetical protein
MVSKRLLEISVHLTSLRLCSPFLRMVASLVATQVGEEEEANDDEDEDEELEEE